MKTIVAKVDLRQASSAEVIQTAAKILQEGGLVAFPTETVYGLGGNGLDSAACEKIYLAKGRPSDNPLILHISEIEELDRITKGNAIITTDVGQHQMWAAQYYHYTKPRTFLSSGGLGTMGYGIGACIGAKTGCPDKICVNIGGDGCFRMNLIELATASRYQIPIIQIIINNHVLGMVRQWQTLFYGKRYSQTVLEDAVDYCKVAEGLGCAAIRVTAKEEVAPAIEKAIALQKPVVIDCRIPEDDKVFPMVPAGAAISEVFDGDDLASK